MRFGSNARRSQVRMPAVLRTRSKESSIEQKPASRTRTRSRRGKRGRDDDDDDDDDEESDDAYDEVGNDYDEYASRAKLATNRPFEIVAGLPASVELPNYNSSLTHPQSIKNSGVLYDSLVSPEEPGFRVRCLNCIGEDLRKLLVNLPQQRRRVRHLERFL